VGVAFHPTAVGSYSTSFHMSFQDSQTGAPATVQTLTLQGVGV
jgi:hypothetical protein